MLIASSCGGRGNNGDSESSISIGNTENPLYGKIFNANLFGGKITGLPELEYWKYVGCSFINDDYYIYYARDENDNIVFIFIESQLSENRILDTLNIGKLQPNESWTKCGGRHYMQESNVIKGEIVFVVHTDKPNTNKIYIENILRAWRLNEDTGKFEAISSDVRCKNRDFGMSLDVCIKSNFPLPHKNLKKNHTFSQKKR